MSTRVSTESPNPILANVDSEHGRLRSAVILKTPDNIPDISWEMLCQLITPENRALHPEMTGPVCSQLMRDQHARFVELLESHGVRIITSNPVYGPTGKPDALQTPWCQVYTRDPYAVIGETSVECSMRDDYRMGELEGWKDIRRAFGSRLVSLTNHDLKNPHRPIIEGGDIFPSQRGSRVLVGTKGQITNEVGFNALRGALVSRGIEAFSFDHTALHGDCCYAPLPNGEAIVSSQVPSDGRDVISRFHSRLHTADDDEARLKLALNCFWLDPDTVVMEEEAPKTAQLLRSLGYDVRQLAYSQFTNTWGGFRCTACPTERDAV